MRATSLAGEGGAGVAPGTLGATGRGAAQAGFTLLEVLVAVAILALSLSSLLTSQVEAMRNGRYAQQVSVAAMLAEYQLIEIEFENKRLGWQSNDVEYEGDFADLGWSQYSYECLVDYILLPDYSDLREAKAQMDHATDGDQAYIQDAGDVAFAGMGTVWPIIKGAIESSIRKVSCKVSWMDGRRRESLEVVTFWTDPARLDEVPGINGLNPFEDDSGTEGGQGGAGGGGSTGPQRPGGTTNVGLGGVAP